MFWFVTFNYNYQILNSQEKSELKWETNYYKAHVILKNNLKASQWSGLSRKLFNNTKKPNKHYLLLKLTNRAYHY